MIEHRAELECWNKFIKQLLEVSVRDEVHSRKQGKRDEQALFNLEQRKDSMRDIGIDIF